MVARVIPVDPFDPVVFGGTGEPAHRDIPPGIPPERRLRCREGLMPPAARGMAARGLPPPPRALRAGASAAQGANVGAGERAVACAAAFRDGRACGAGDVRRDAGWPGLTAAIRPGVPALFCLAMAPPNGFEPAAARGGKLMVLCARDPLRPIAVVRGQDAATDGPRGYPEEVVHPDRRPERSAAPKLRIPIRRWRLRARSSEIAVPFRGPPHPIFGEGAPRGAKVPIIRRQPDAGLRLPVLPGAPRPGGLRCGNLCADEPFAAAPGDGGAALPEACARLIVGVVGRNQTRFLRGDGVDAARPGTDAGIAAREEPGGRPLPCDAGTSRPGDALMLMHRDGRRWREIRP